MAVKLGETRLGEINLTANIGMNISSKPETTSFISGAVGIGMPVFPFLSAMGELVTEQAIATGEDGTREQLLRANIGFMGNVSKQILLFASFGHSLYSSDSDSHTYILGGMRLLAGGV